MKVIELLTLKAFWGNDPSFTYAIQPTLAWYRHVLKANWKSFAKVKADFRNASILKDGRAVFNIAGNKYRIIVWVNYAYGVVYVRFIGTHAQYDQIDTNYLIQVLKMGIKPIKTDADYRAALKEVESLMPAEPNTPEGEKLDILVTLIEAYEHKHFPFDLPDPVEAIKFEREQKGLTIKDLKPMIGKSNRVYEILSRKRSLTLKMIWKLHRELDIPAEA